MGNKVHADVKNATAFPLTTGTDGTVSFGAAQKIPGLMNIALDADGDQVITRADGVDYYVSNGNNGYSGDLGFAMVPDDFKVAFLGESLVSTDLVQVEYAHAEPQPFALAFEFVGDQNNIKHILYNVIASRSSIAGDNKDNPKEPDTETLTIKASPLADGKVKARTTDTTPATVLEAWFTTAYVPGAATVPETQAAMLKTANPAKGN